MVDTPLHVHSREDELSTSSRASTSSRWVSESTGWDRARRSSLRAASPTPSAGSNRESAASCVLTPGGFEQFFRDLAEADRNDTLGPDAYAEASERAGIGWL